MQRIAQHAPRAYALLLGLFFVLILYVKASYSLIPLLLTLAGLRVLYQKRRQIWHAFPEYRPLVFTFALYFGLFLLSLLLHHGKAKELDLPSRALLMLPIFALLVSVPFKKSVLLHSLLLAANLAGVVALVQVYGFHLEKPFPSQMHIQAGGIAMSLSLFSLCLFFHFYARQQRPLMWAALTGFFLALLASFLTTARGAWAAFPVGLIVILWLNRRLLSKKITLGILAIGVLGLSINHAMILDRLQQAETEVQHYASVQDGNTSVGARLDMWKSALLGIQEKPLFGWGLEGVKTMRQQHFEQGLISQFAAQFSHSHNQYLHDGTARGILGILALLGIFFVPLTLFWRNLKRTSLESHTFLFGTLGIVHILAMMVYCLSQSFFAHNSGISFYSFGVIIFFALQKISQTAPNEG